MKFNGSVISKGKLDQLDQILDEPSDGGGFENNERKGVWKFNNGLKVQWNTVSVAANSTTAVDLEEAYTEDHYIVFCQYSSGATLGGNQQDVAAWVPTANKLSQAVLFTVHNGGNKDITYLSIGKDLI